MRNVPNAIYPGVLYDAYRTPRYPSATSGQPDALPSSVQDVGVDHRRYHALVPDQLLHGPAGIPATAFTAKDAKSAKDGVRQGNGSATAFAAEDAGAAEDGGWPVDDHDNGVATEFTEHTENGFRSGPAVLRIPAVAFLCVLCELCGKCRPPSLASLAVKAVARRPPGVLGALVIGSSPCRRPRPAGGDRPWFART